MALDAPLVAAVTLNRHGLDVSDDDSATRQLQLAHVLLDGGYDGVATMAEALAGGDHGLGTLDRLDGELVVADGVPWQIDSTGRANQVPLNATTPFVVVTHFEPTASTRLTDCSRDDLVSAIATLAPRSDAVLAVRVEGSFSHVLVRSVPAQEKPYRPYVEVCATDEVRFEYAPFEGVFIGFQFPELGADGATIAGLHLHGLSADQSTGGHNYDLTIDDAVVSIGVSHEVGISLPDRAMVDLLDTPADMRAVQRALLRRGPRTRDQLSHDVGLTVSRVDQTLLWLGDRGYIEELPGGVAGLGGEPRWKVRLTGRATHGGDRVSAALTDL